MTYQSGFVHSYKQWIGKFSNQEYDYFARHASGNKIKYKFNSIGYRGPEHHLVPDISIFGSSFSFGVGLEFDRCWHQQLGEYKINCYAPAGFLMTNDDIIDHYKEINPPGQIILQLRESKYNRATLTLPDTKVFIIDEYSHPFIFSLTYNTMVDKAEDQIHPGIQTHKLWAFAIKKKFNL
jgi:hypothetical protein